MFKQASDLGNATAMGKVAFAQLVRQCFLCVLLVIIELYGLQFGSYTPQNFTGALEKFAALADKGLPLGQMV